MGIGQLPVTDRQRSEDWEKSQLHLACQLPRLAPPDQRREDWATPQSLPTRAALLQTEFTDTGRTQTPLFRALNSHRPPRILPACVHTQLAGTVVVLRDCASLCSTRWLSRQVQTSHTSITYKRLGFSISEFNFICHTSLINELN